MIAPGSITTLYAPWSGQRKPRERVLKVASRTTTKPSLFKMASFFNGAPPVDHGSAADTSIVPEPSSFADGTFFSTDGAGRGLWGWMR